MPTRCRFAEALARGDGDVKSMMLVEDGDVKSMMVVLARFAGDLRRTGMELCDDGVFGVPCEMLLKWIWGEIVARMQRKG